MAYFKVLSQHLPVQTKKKQKNTRAAGKIDRSFSYLASLLQVLRL